MRRVWFLRVARAAEEFEQVHITSTCLPRDPPRALLLHPPRLFLRQCRELLMAPRARLERTRDNRQSSTIETFVCNLALQSLRCPGGLTRWTHAIFWRFRRTMLSRRNRVHPQ